MKMSLPSKKSLAVIVLILAATSAASYFFIFHQGLFSPKTIKIFSSPDEEIAEQKAETKESVENIAKNINPVKGEKPAETPPLEKKEDAQKSDELGIANKYVSWGYEKSSGRKIDTIIIHSSYNALGGDPYDLDKLLVEYRQYNVAPHYLIDRQGKTYRLVSEKNVAYHAGESKTPDGRTNVNNFSVGIELINKEDDKFTSSQYASLNDLLRYLRSKYNIKYTLGHNQIAPGRKTDPWNFEWNKVNR